MKLDKSIFALAAFLSTVNAARKHFQVARQAADGRVDVPMYFEDDLPYGEVDISGQVFRVVFDTASPITWVPSVDCHSSDCDGRDLFDPEESPNAVDLHTKVSVDFGGDKCIDARLYNDTITLGTESNNARIEKHLIAAAYRVRGFKDAAYVGRLGCGGASSASTYDLLTSSDKPAFLRKRNPAVDANAGITINTVPTFAIALAVAPGGGPLKRRQIESNGVCTLGPLDTSLYKGDVHYTPIAPESFGPMRYWRTPLTCVELGDVVNFQLEANSYAIFSTAITTITAPPAQADAFHDAIGATFDAASGTYLLSCSNAANLPKLKFQFAGFNVELPPSVWVGKIEGEDDLCYTKIGRNILDLGTDWALGTTFLNPFYHIYDTANSQIGLAQRVLDDSDIVFS